MNTTVEVLNDLIQINNDRIAGYRRAIDESENLDIDLKATFSNYINDSEDFVDQLTIKVIENGGTPAEDSTLAGKIYRAWMDVKATFTGNDRRSILASCEFGEDAAQKAYTAALAEGAHIKADVLQLIGEQRQALKRAHDLIKRYRDALDIVNK